MLRRRISVGNELSRQIFLFSYRESPKQFGGIQACLMQLKPVYKMVTGKDEFSNEKSIDLFGFVVSEGQNIIFMNTKLRGVSELGLFIGRDRTRPFLNIDGDFFNAKHLNGEGRLVAIDVWGVGGKASADEQDNMRQWEDKQIEKSRKVKPRYFVILVVLLSYLLYRSRDLMKKKKRFLT